MKRIKLKSLFYNILMLGIVYMIASTAGSQVFAASATISVGVFSAIVHTSQAIDKAGWAFTAGLLDPIVVPEFKAKTAEEIEKMDTNELLKYRGEQREFDTATLRKELQDQLIALKAENDDKNEEKIKELTGTIDTMSKDMITLGLLIKAATEKGGTLENDKPALIKFIERKSIKESLDKKQAGMESVEIKADVMLREFAAKAAALMTTANVVPNAADGFNQLFGNYIDPNIHHAPKADNFILPLVSVTTAPGTENIWYVERENEEGDAAFIAEGALKPLIDGEWKEKKADIKEVAERWKMSRRLILHAPSVVNDFRKHADELIESKIDDGVAAGTGIGDEMNGIITLASPFIVPPALANFYTSTNIWDVINAISSYVRLNNFKGKLTCVLNTVWQAKMQAYKTTEGVYIIPPFVTPDGKTVGETRVVFTNKFSEDNILLGDLKRFNVVISENIMYFEGWENDDFSKNLVSRKLEAFLGSYLPTSDAGSIIYDDIATVMTAITVI